MKNDNPYSSYPETPFSNGGPGGGDGYDPGYDRPRSGGNAMGVVGFILAFLLPPIGVIVSLIALRKRPRAFAIAGVVIGVLMSGCVGFCGFFAIIGVNAAMEARPLYDEVTADYQAIEAEVEAYRAANGSMPSDLSSLSLSQDQLEDPYGNEYIFQTGAGDWSIGFKGRDGIRGSEDDCTLPSGISGGSFAQYQYQELYEALTTGIAMEKMGQ